MGVHVCVCVSFQSRILIYFIAILCTKSVQFLVSALTYKIEK